MKYEGFGLNITMAKFPTSIFYGLLTCATHVLKMARIKTK